jgi:RHS repeat-associated protein
MHRKSELGRGVLRRMALMFALAAVSAPTLGETVTYVYTDLQNTVLATTDEHGGIITSRDYHPYGKTAIGSSNGTPGYTGHVEDAESDLIYMQARYYDPELARFLSIDPVMPSAGDVLSDNRYAYVQNNPITHTDPTGMMSCNESGEVSPEVQRMRNASDKCQSNSDSASVVAIGVGGGALEGVSMAALRASPILGALALSGDTVRPKDEQFVYVTYVRTNANSGVRYSGRTSGFINVSTPLPGLMRIVAQRNAGQPLLNAEGFGPGVVDAYSSSKMAIRGREQQLIDYYGGARSMGGTARNMINGISPLNELKPLYMLKSNSEFGGPLPNNSPIH